MFSALLPAASSASSARIRERFGLEVDPDVLIELDRMGLIEEVGDYKGYPIYDATPAGKPSPLAKL